MSAVPKSQWSWEFSDRMGKGEAQLLIFDYKRMKALLGWEEGHWVLPGMVCHLDHWTLAENMQKSLKLAGCIWPAHIAWSATQTRSFTHKNGNTGTQELEKIVLVAECCEDEPPVVRGYEWQSLEDKEVFHLFDRAASRIKEEIGMALSGVYPEKRMYWERPGWLLKVISIVENATDSDVVKPISMLGSSSKGAVVRVCTSKGKFFVKSSPGSRNDCSFSEAMARIVPEYCEMPVCVDKENRTMIMRDYGESVLIDFPYKTAEAGEVYGTLTSVQQSTIGKMDDLLRAGFMDARPEAWAERFEEVANHRELYFVEDFCQGYPEEFAFSKSTLKHLALLRNKTSQMRKAVQEISETVLKMPATVLHNDIFTNNTCRDTETGKLKVIDWELGCIGHPFMEKWCSWPSMPKHWKGYCAEEEIWKCRQSIYPMTYVVDLLQHLNIMAEIEEHGKVNFLHGVYVLLSSMNNSFRKKESK